MQFQSMHKFFKVLHFFQICPAKFLTLKWQAIFYSLLSSKNRFKCLKLTIKFRKQLPHNPFLDIGRK